MMLGWNEYHKEIGNRLGELMKLSPDTLGGYRRLSDANAKTGHLDAKTRQLISLAVAVATHCDGCIVVHADAALKADVQGRDQRSLRPSSPEATPLQWLDSV